MGNCVGGFKRRTHRIAPWKRNKPIVLCFIGIDGAGKTTIVKALQGEDLGTVHSTVGFSRAELRVKKYRVTVYDLGGSVRIRDIWPIYFAEVFGIVFVMDASAASRISENKKMVDALVGLPDLLGKPILFLLNKKDLPEAMDEMQFSERFNLHSMAKLNKTDIRVEGTCAVKGTGKEVDQVVVEGLEWLIEKVLDNYDNISKGVEKALKELKERQAQERLERQHRLALSGSKESPEAVGTPEDGFREEEERKEQGPVGNGQRRQGSGQEKHHHRLRQSSAQSGQQQSEETTIQRPAANGGVDYGLFEISAQRRDSSAIGEGRVNETMTISDEQKEDEEENGESGEYARKRGTETDEQRGDGRGKDGVQVVQHDIVERGEVQAVQHGIVERGEVQAVQHGIVGRGEVQAVQHGIVERGEVQAVQHGIVERGEVQAVQHGIVEAIEMRQTSGGCNRGGSVH